MYNSRIFTVENLSSFTAKQFTIRANCGHTESMCWTNTSFAFLITLYKM